MTRRKYIQKMVQAFQAAMAWNLLAGCSLPRAGNLTVTEKDLHYRPLNGRRMVDLVQARIHHGPNRFLSPFSNLDRRNSLRVLRWKLFSTNTHRQHYDSEQVQPVNIDWQSIRTGNDLSVTLIKHAGLLIKDQDTYLLIDPVFQKIFWFIEDFTPLNGNLKDMPKIDHVLLTHGHYDHIDVDSLTQLDPTTHAILPLGYNDIFDGLGMRNRHHLDWFESYHSNGQEIIFVPCNHWTMRNPFIGPNTGLWGSYIIRTKSGATIYIAGDTGYFDGFTELGEMYDIDLAIFNLGAYEPRWFMAPSHMNPEETYRAFQELGARNLMLAHWGTFRLGDEPVHFPPIDMQRVLAENMVEEQFIHINHGQTVIYG